MIVWTITRVTESFVPVSAVSFTIRVGTPGVGVPPGGATGTVLRKASADDYDTEWGGVTASSITDSTATGRAVLTAASAAAARSAIGAGVGDALTSGTLAQFAATTSAQLAGVLTDETGSGAAVFGTSPTITTPVFSGMTVVRQAGGTAGTDEVQISHNGTSGRIESRDGGLGFRVSGFDALSINAASAIFGVSAWVQGSVFVGTVQDVALSRNASGVFEINNGTVGTLRDLRLRNLTASGLTTLGVYTVGTLPSASANVGAIAQATDSNSTTRGATPAGGGSNRVIVFALSTGWVII